MADPSQELLTTLSRDWLWGYPGKDKHGGPIIQYVDEKGEEHHRRALAKLLQMGNPPPEVCGLLASLIAPDDIEIASERKLVFAFRNRQKTRPFNRRSDPSVWRNSRIMERVASAREQEGSVEKAVALVADETGMSEGHIWTIWQSYSWLRQWPGKIGEPKEE